MLWALSVRDGHLRIRAGDWCRCARVHTTPNVKTPARRERQMGPWQRGKVGLIYLPTL